MKKGDFVCFYGGINKDIYRIKLKPRIKSGILYITILFHGKRREIMEQFLRLAEPAEIEANQVLV